VGDRLGDAVTVIGAAYLAAAGFEAELAEELRRAGHRIDTWHGRLALSPGPPLTAAWALDTWTAPVEHPAPSIRAAADTLRGMQRNWAVYAVAHHRRSALIDAALPPVRARPLLFPQPAPTAHLGAWTLLTPDRLLASPTKSSPFPNGECHFVEDRTGPPSRAYLKFWEACTRLGRFPKPGETAIDLGAAPGGWTWALAQCGTAVTAVDKAPLDAAVAALSNVVEVQESAFALTPTETDWLCCDVACYPARLLGLLQRWVGVARTIVATIKFQGETDHAILDAFRALPGAVVFHGFHNKHEVTFCRDVSAAP